MPFLWLIAGLISLGYIAYRLGWFDDLMLHVGIALAMWLTVGGAAFAAETVVTAQGATSATTTISLVPLYVQLIPYIAAGIGGIFVAVCSWAVTKFTGIKVSENDRSIVEKAVERAAGRFMAAQTEPVSGIKVDVHSQFVADESRIVMAQVGDTLAKLGVTPETVQAMIVGEIGKLSSASAAPVAIAAASAPAKPA